MNVYLALLNPDDYFEDRNWVVVVAPGEDQARSLIWENYRNDIRATVGLKGDERSAYQYRVLQEEIVLHKIDISKPMVRQLKVY